MTYLFLKYLSIIKKYLFVKMTSRYANISSGKQLELDILTKSYDSDNNQEKVNLSIQSE